MLHTSLLVLHTDLSKGTTEEPLLLCHLVKLRRAIVPATRGIHVPTDQREWARDWYYRHKNLSTSLKLAAKADGMRILSTPASKIGGARAPLVVLGSLSTLEELAWHGILWCMAEHEQMLLHRARRRLGKTWPRTELGSPDGNISSSTIVTVAGFAFNARRAPYCHRPHSRLRNSNFQTIFNFNFGLRERLHWLLSIFANNPPP